jgi:hypothetical protein
MLNGQAPPVEWWAHLVGALRVHPLNIAPTILRKKIEDRECCARLGGPRGSFERVGGILEVFQDVRQLPRFRAHLASDPLYHHSCRLAARDAATRHSAHSEDMALDFSSPVEQELGLRQHIDHGYVQNTRVLVQLKMLGHCGPSGAGPPSRVLRHSDDSVTTIGARPSIVRQARRRQRKRELADWYFELKAGT